MWLAQFKRTINKPIVIVVATLFLSLFYMSFYLGGELRGNINWFMLPAKMFGVPKPLLRHGIRPIYNHLPDTGWDGQFYYYVSNDLLGNVETASHFGGGPSYRYQRVGLPLLAKLGSLLTFHSWVSPLAYYLTNLLLVLLATYALSCFFLMESVPPFYALFWSMGLGTQLTLLNGLPDAAADGLLILSLIAFVRQRFVLFSLAATLAALTREAYILLPMVMGLVEGVQWLLKKDESKAWRSFLKILLRYAFPIVIFMAWRFYVSWHFHATPSSAAGEVLGWPFWYWLHYFRVTPELRILVSCFLLLCAASILSVKVLIDPKRSLVERSIALGFCLLFLMYFSFGPVVMVSYTGYCKPINIAAFYIPFVYACQKKKIPILGVAVLILVTVFQSFYFYQSRLGAIPTTLFDNAHYPFGEKIPNQKISCLKNHHSRLSLLEIEDFYYNDWFRRFRGSPEIKVFKLKVENLTDQSFIKTTGAGAVRLSYEWLNPQGAVVLEGGRTFLSTLVLPHASVEAELPVIFPKKPGDYTLALSLMQEGCSWFYQADQSSGLYFRYVMH